MTLLMGLHVTLAADHGCIVSDQMKSFALLQESSSIKFDACRLVDEIVWVKMTVNRRLAKSHGYYLQHAKEVCLVGKKGADPPGTKNSVGSDIIYSERRGQSQKPEEIYQLVEELVPNGKGCLAHLSSSLRGQNHATLLHGSAMLPCGCYITKNCKYMTNLSLSWRFQERFSRVSNLLMHHAAGCIGHRLDFRCECVCREIS